MTGVMLRWQNARWRRRNPGGTGLALLALLPLLFLLPLQRVPMFATWRDGAGTLTLILALAVTGLCTRDSARVPPAAVWLFQKGVPLEDATLVRWIIDVATVALVCLWCALGMSVGAAVHGVPDVGWLIRVTAGTLVAVVLAASLLFGLAASGTDRGGDVLALLLFAALAEPLLALMLPVVARTTVHALLLPLIEGVGLPRRLQAEPASALHASLHVVAWCTAWLAFGVWRLRRWRPAPGPGPGS